ncbi:C40 family peptidase [Actinomyces succiniciruminis]|uniref:C40 family peptidase n=1 Tax=Actinomyces succiniciruminis TaxID=1522002 RepID=UPI001B32C8CA|nr:C40 family peptidase [Actinomyces succiniciruminis]
MLGLVLGAPLVPIAGFFGLALLGEQQSVAAGGSSIVCDTGGASVTARDASGTEVTLDATQVRNAAIVVQAGQSMGQQAQVIALATALTESGLRNLANDGSFAYSGGVMSLSAWESARSVVMESMRLPHDGVGSDWDSIGLFQQRPSAGWGSVEEIMDPATSAATFYDRLSSVAGWESMSVAAAAQAVQVSALPSAYARWEPVARSLLSVLSTVHCTGGEGMAALGGVPAGLDEKRTKVVTFALQQIGDSYVWGAEGSDSWDCSGLVQGAYRQIGVELEHWSEAQRTAGREVSASEALPGDIMWWPGHVAIYLGNGELVGAQGYSQGVVRIPVYGAPRYIRVIE